MAQLGRISGPLLEANLLRNGRNLAFRNTFDATQLLFLDVVDGKVSVNNAVPTHELYTSGTTRTTDLIVDNCADIPNFTICNNDINIDYGDITISAPTAVVVSNLETSDFFITDNIISTKSSNTDIDLMPNGTGTLEIQNNLLVNGNLHATGNVTLDGTITFGDTLSQDTVDFNTDIASDIIPDQTDTYNLGSLSKSWNQLHANTFNGQNIFTKNITVAGLNFSTSYGNVIYVAETGNDTNVGSRQGPLKTIKEALSRVDASTNSPTAIYVLPGGYEEETPLVVPSNVSIIGEDLRNTVIRPESAYQSNDVFLLSDSSTIANLTVRDFYYDSINNTGYAVRFAPNAIISNRSPYIQNISVITSETGNNTLDAGRGAWIDGDELSSFSVEASMLFHSCTFITPNADCINMTNGVRVEWLNSFTYFANRGLYAFNGAEGRTTYDGSTVNYGAEIRSIGSANVYGTYGAVADGADTLMYLIQHNFGYIGSGLDSSNDKTLAIQANEAVELNSGKIYYQSMDHLGNFRVGDVFYADFETGTTSIDTSALDFDALSILTVGTGGNITTLSIDKVETGNIRFSGNRIDSLVGELNIDSASGEINLPGDVAVEKDLDIIGNLTFDGTLNLLGNQTTDTLEFKVDFDQDLNPNIDSRFNLGSATKEWLNGYLSEANAGDIRFFDSIITTSASNANLDLRANGTGIISIPNNNVLISNALTTNGLTTLDDIVINGSINSGEGRDQVGDLSATNISITGNLNIDSSAFFEEISIVGNVITTTTSNTDLELRANGTGIINVQEDLRVENSLSVNDVNTTGDITIADTVTANDVSISEIDIYDNVVTTTVSNADLELRASKAVTPAGEEIFDTNGAHTWTVPAGVTEISIVAVGAGGRADTASGYSGGGGGLRYYNSLPVTPGQTYDIYVPRPSSTGETLPDTTFSLGGTEILRAGSGTLRFGGTGTAIGGNIGGGNGGNGGSGGNTFFNVAGGGGGAGGYSGNGGNGAAPAGNGGNGSGGAGGGGASGSGWASGLGGGVGLFGEGASGTGGIYGNGTTDGNPGSNGIGKNYGGGGNAGTTTRKVPGGGALRIIWGEGRSFPSTNVEQGATVSSNAVNDTTVITAPANDVEVAQDLTVNGSTNLKNLNIVGSLLHTGSRTQTGNYTIAGEIINGDILIEDNFITTTTSNSNLDLRASGTGVIAIPNNNVTISNNLTVSSNTDLQSTAITGSLLHTGNRIQTGDYTQGGELTVDNLYFEDNFVTTLDANGNLDLRANGTGVIVAPTNDVEIANNLTVSSLSTLTDTSVTGLITHIGNRIETGNYTIAGEINNGNILIEDNFITTTQSNSDLELIADISPYLDAGTSSASFLSTYDGGRSSTTSFTEIITGGTATQDGEPGLMVFKNDAVLENQLEVIGNTYVTNLSINGTITHTGNKTQIGNLTQTGVLVVNGNFTSDRKVQFSDVKIENNFITTTVDNNDLILKAAGTGTVTISSTTIFENDLTVTNLIANTINIDQTLSLNEIIIPTLNLEIDDNFITTLNSNSNLELRATGDVVFPNNELQVNNNLTVIGTSNFNNTVLSGTITHAGNRSQTGSYTQTGNVVAEKLSFGSDLTVANILFNDNYISSTTGNLVLQAAGTGVVLIDDAVVDNNLTANDLYANNIAVSGQLGLELVEFSGDIQIFDNVITTTNSNSDLELRTVNNNNIKIEDIIVNNFNISTVSNNLTFDVTDSLTISSDAALGLPTGPDRPSNQTGDLRFNTSSNSFEGRVSGGNVTFGGVYSSDRQTSVTAHPTNNTISLKVNNVNVSTVNLSGLSLHGLQVEDVFINNNSIVTNTSNSDLIFGRSGTGKLVIGDLSLIGEKIQNNSATNLTLSTTANGYVKFATTVGFVLPAGSDLERPVSPETGDTRWNTDSEVIEVWDGSTYVTAAGTSETISEEEFNDLMLEYTIIFG